MHDAALMLQVMAGRDGLDGGRQGENAVERSAVPAYSEGLCTSHAEALALLKEVKCATLKVSERECFGQLKTLTITGRVQRSSCE